MKMSHRTRRLIAGAIFFFGVAFWLVVNPDSYDTVPDPAPPLGVTSESTSDGPLAITLLEELEIKGRAPKTGYARMEFYNGWPDVDGCSLRQRIIKRDVGSSAVLDGCNVIAGKFTEPYTGEYREYTTREEFSRHIQIDHIVALSDAWQKGAQYLPKDIRYQIATDPLNLIAADGPANMQKGDGDAATWLPPNKSFRCAYVARQVSVKYKYHLWMTQAEHDAVANILELCPNEPATVEDSNLQVQQ